MTETTPASVRPSRDPWFDNAKMVLVTLVVIGHGLMLLESSELHNHIYDFIYAWHMPAFVLVTGYLSRSFGYSRARLWKLVRSVAVPYVLMETALAAFRIFVGGERMDDLYADPHWPLWFLPALFFWRLLTPPLRRLGVWALPLAVVVSLAGGYLDLDTDYLSVRRILGMLPFFVIGMLLRPGLLAWLRSVPARIAGVVGLVLIGVITTTAEGAAQTRWLYYSWAYDDLDASLPAPITRIAVLLIGVVGALSALALIPRRGGWFTRMGSMSLVVYLCHGFVVKGLHYAGYPDWTAKHDIAALVLDVVGGIALAMLLASPPVAKRLERAVDPLAYADDQIDRAFHLNQRAEQLRVDGVTGEERAADGRVYSDRYASVP